MKRVRMSEFDFCGYTSIRTKRGWRPIRGEWAKQVVDKRIKRLNQRFAKYRPVHKEANENLT